MFHWWENMSQIWEFCKNTRFIGLSLLPDIAFCEIGHDSAKSKQASLCSRCFPIFTAGHAVGGAEETGEGGTAGDT